MSLNSYGGLLFVILISLKIYLACLKQPLFTRNLGLSRKHLYINGKETRRGVAKQKNRYLQLGSKFINGKNMGAPAQTIVRMFTEIVLNLIAN